MNVVDPKVRLQPAFVWIAEELDHLRPNVRENESLGVRFPRNGAGRLKQEPEAFLVIEKYQLNLLALGNVSNHGGDEHIIGGLHRTQADFHGHLATILAPGGKFEVRPHGPDLRIAKVIIAMMDVAASEMFGQKNFHALTNKLFGAVAEHYRHLSVGHDNLTIPIHGDDRIGGGVKEGPEKILRLHARDDFTLEFSVGLA